MNQNARVMAMTHLLKMSLRVLQQNGRFAVLLTDSAAHVLLIPQKILVPIIAPDVHTIPILFTLHLLFTTILIWNLCASPIY